MQRTLFTLYGCWRLFAALSVLWVLPIVAADQQGVTLKAVEDDLSLTLSSGQLMKLSGIWVIDALGVKALLLDHRGKTVTALASHEDRYGMARGDLLIGNDMPRSVREELVAKGLALAHASALGTPTPEMWRAERRAEQEREGIWHALDFITTTGTAPKRVDKFVLIRGRPLSVGIRERFSYLNFGDDWQTDLTIKIPTAIANRLAQDGIQIAALTGKEVEVRGWLVEDRGPALTLDDARHLRLLEGGTP